MPEIRVQDEQGTIHVFPDGSTPEMIAKVMNVRPPSATTTEPRSWLDSAKDFASEAWNQVNPVAAVKGLAQAANHPIDTGKQLLLSQADVEKKAEESFKKGDYGTGVRHVLNYLLPVLGPQIDRAGDLMQSGEYAKGAGATVGIGANVAAPAIIKGGINMVKPAASRALLLGKTPAEAYQSALKPSTTLSEAQRTAIVNTGLREKIPVSAKGLEDLSDLIQDINSKMDAAIKSGQDRPWPAPGAVKGLLPAPANEIPLGPRPGLPQMPGALLPASSVSRRTVQPGTVQIIPPSASSSPGSIAEAIRARNAQSAIGPQSAAVPARVFGTRNPYVSQLGTQAATIPQRVLSGGEQYIPPVVANRTQYLTSSPETLGDVPGVSGAGILRRNPQFPASPSTMPEPTIDPSAVVKRLDALKAKLSKQVSPDADLAAIEAAKQEFLKNNPSPIPASEAADIKSGTYRSLGSKAYGELKGAQIESQKALARGIKEELITQFPELEQLGIRDQQLLNLQPVLERAVNRIGNHQLIGIGTPVATGAAKALTGSNTLAGVAGVLKAVLDNPMVKSRLAIALSKSGVPYQTAVQRVNGYQNALASVAVPVAHESADQTPDQ
jgi:hypothetical protein